MTDKELKIHSSCRNALIMTIFALAEGKDGGTFYTPATVVRYMVAVLNPQPGDKKFLDIKTPGLIQFNYSSADFAA